MGRIPLRAPINLSALLHTISICAPNLRLESMTTPRYLMRSTVSMSEEPNLSFTTLGTRKLVMSITSVFSLARVSPTLMHQSLAILSIVLTLTEASDRALTGLVGKYCLVYLDDIVIFGKTIQEHNENLAIVFQRLRELGLKLQPDKCEFVKPELEYLGHVVSAEGVKPTPRN